MKIYNRYCEVKKLFKWKEEVGWVKRESTVGKRGKMQVSYALMSLSSLKMESCANINWRNIYVHILYPGQQL